MNELPHDQTHPTLTTKQRSYALNVHYLKNPDFKAGLEEYLAEAGTAAIVLGTRRCAVLLVVL